MAELVWLEKYSGQTVEELLALEPTHQMASLVCAFEGALSEKTERDGDDRLTQEELIILAVEDMERLVNNGGYRSFLEDCHYNRIQIIVDALRRIGCQGTAEMTQEAVAAIPTEYYLRDRVCSFLNENENAEAILRSCDNRYFENEEGNDEGIARKLFQFIKANKDRISF